jgi:hypothetical protein
VLTLILFASAAAALDGGMMIPVNPVNTKRKIVFIGSSFPIVTR